MGYHEAHMVLCMPGCLQAADRQVSHRHCFEVVHQNRPARDSLWFEFASDNVKFLALLFFLCLPLQVGSDVVGVMVSAQDVGELGVEAML